MRQTTLDCTEAWRRQDSVAFGQPFTDPAEFTSIADVRRHGRSENTHVDSQIRDIRFLRPDVAAVEVQPSV